MHNSNYQLETHSSCASRVQLVPSPSAHFVRNHLTAKHTKPNQLVYVLYELAGHYCSPSKTNLNSLYNSSTTLYTHLYRASMQEMSVLPRAPKNVTERFSLSCCKLGEADRHKIYYGAHSCSTLEAVVRTPKLAGTCIPQHWSSCNMLILCKIRRSWSASLKLKRKLIIRPQRLAAELLPQYSTREFKTHVHELQANKQSSFSKLRSAEGETAPCIRFATTQTKIYYFPQQLQHQ